MTRDTGDVLRTRAATPAGLSRFASSCQHRIAIAWRAWRGKTGDEIILVAGLGALIAYITRNHGFPDPLPIAVFACLLLHGRQTERSERTGA